MQFIYLHSYSLIIILADHHFSLLLRRRILDNLCSSLWYLNSLFAGSRITCSHSSPVADLSPAGYLIANRQTR